MAYIFPLILIVYLENIIILYPDFILTDQEYTIVDGAGVACNRAGLALPYFVFVTFTIHIFDPKFIIWICETAGNSGGKGKNCRWLIIETC